MLDAKTVTNRWPPYRLTPLYENTFIASHARSRQRWLILFSLDECSVMSKRTFRLILAAYLAFETIASFYNAFFGVRVPTNIVGQLYSVFGPPVVLPQWVALAVGVTSIVLFIWAFVGLFLFWPSARPIFVVTLLAVAAAVPLKPFYIISGWFEVIMHIRLLFHGFIICLIYFGPPREYYVRQSV
jgi:hypothetical protein